MKEQIGKLAMMLGMGGANGAVSIAAAQGFFTLQNAPIIAVLFMAGPGAIMTAVLMQGDVKQRMIAALVSGVIATAIVVFAAGLGPKLLDLVNMNLLKIFGGIAVLAIGLLIMGLKVPDKIPIAIMIIGLVAAIVWR